MGAWSPAWLAARLLACGVLVVGLAGALNADQVALAPLLKSLDLRDYTLRTAPPPFSGSTLDARPLSITAYRGSVIILNFWASWCLDCRPEMPVLQRLQREFSSRGLAVIGVNAREDKEAARRYATELGLTFPIVLDRNGAINTLYGVVGLPTTFVIGRDGRAIGFAVGSREWESAPARALIAALLAEPAPPPIAQ
jgi:thiol-disulfide isomerase/thioredoxin